MARTKSEKIEVTGVCDWHDSKKRHIDFGLDGVKYRISGFSKQGVPPLGMRVCLTIEDHYGIVLAWREVK